MSPHPARDLEPAGTGVSAGEGDGEDQSGEDEEPRTFHQLSHKTLHYTMGNGG